MARYWFVGLLLFGGIEQLGFRFARKVGVFALEHGDQYAPDYAPKDANCHGPGWQYDHPALHGSGNATTDPDNYST